MVCVVVVVMVVVAAVGVVTGTPKKNSTPYQPEGAAMATLASR